MVEAIQPFMIDSNGRLVPQQFAPGTITSAPDAPTGSALGAGLRSGGDLFVKNLGGAVAALGQTLGSQGVQDFGTDVAQRYSDYAREASRPDLEANPWSASGFGYKVAQSLPSLGAMLAGTVIGSVKGGQLGATLGGALTAAPETAGAYFNTAMEQPGGAKEGEAGRALLLGGGLGTAMSMVPPGVGRALEALTLKGTGERMLKGGMIAGGLTGVQSGVDTAVDQTFRDDPGSFMDRSKEIVQSALSGFAMGGLMGAGIGAVTGRTPTQEIKGKVDDALGLKQAEPDTAAASAEPPGGVAASAPAALADPAQIEGPGKLLALPPPDPNMRTIENQPVEGLQAIQQDLSAKTQRTPQEDQLLARIEAEFNRRTNEPDPAQGQLDLGGTPVGEQPVSRAVREQQEAVAAQQQAFVDQVKAANKGKPTQFSKLLEKQPVTTPEDFAAAVYDNFNGSPSMKKLAGDLGLVDDKGKLFTVDTLDAAHKAAVYQNLLNPSSEGTARVAQLEASRQMLDTIEQKRTASADVPQFEQSPNTSGEMGMPDLPPPSAPRLPLEVPQPLPLEGFTSPLEMIRAHTNNDKAYTTTKIGTPEGEVARMMNTKDLADTNAKTLEPLGLVKDGQRVPYDDAIVDWRAKADAAAQANDPVGRGQALANVEQLNKIKVVDDFNKAQDAAGATLTNKPVQRLYRDLEKLRRQLPADMQGATDQLVEMQRKLIAADGAGRSVVPARAAELAANVRKALDLRDKTGATADLPAATPPVAPGEPTPAATAREVSGTTPSAPELARISTPETRTQMDTDIEHLVSRGASGKDLIAHIAETSANPFMRQLADRLKKLGVDAKIEFASPDGVSFEGTHALQPDQRVTGSYNRDLNRVNVYDRSNLEDTVMHEMVHAATAKAIDRGQHARSMDQLFNALKEQNGADFHGLKNMHEFVAETMTNPRFQEFLKSQPYQKTGNVITDMWTHFKNIVFKALGMDERMRTAFDQAVEGGNKILEGSPVSRDAVGTVPDVERQTSAMMDELPRLQENFDQFAEAGQEALRTGKSKLSNAADFLQKQWNNFSQAGAIARRERDQMVKEHAVRFVEEKHTRSTIYRQLAGLSDTFRKSFGELKGKAQIALADISQYDALGIDPRRNWLQQPALHDRPEMKALVDEANQKYNRLVQLGGEKAYTDAVTTNRTVWYGEQIKTLELMARAYAQDLGLTGFDVPVAKRFQTMDELHVDNPQGAHDFWKAAYDDQIGQYKKALGEKAAEITGLRAQGKNSEAAKIFEKYAGVMDWVKRIDQSVQQAEAVPNFHKGRYGDYAVSGHFNILNGKLDARAVKTLKARIDAATGGDTVFHVNGDNPTILMRFEDRDVAHNVAEIMKQAQADGLLFKDKPVKYFNVGDDDAKIQGVLPKYALDLWEQLQSSELYKDQTPEGLLAQAEQRRRFMAAWLDTVPDNAVSHVLTKREFTQGSSNEILRNFVHRNNILAHSISQGATSGALNEAAGLMRARIEQMKGTSKPVEIDNAQRTFRSLVQQENETPQRVEDTFLHTLQSVNHTYFLGFSPSYVMMQMLQPVQTALPELGKHFGYVQSAKAMAQVIPEVTKIMTAIIRSPGRVDGVITRDILKKQGVSDKIIDATMRGVNEGSLDMSGPVRALGSISKGTEQAWHNKLTRVGSTLPMWSETASRLVVHLAADRLYDMNPEKARFPGARFDPNMSASERAKQKAAYTRFVVYETMGRYGSGEAPRVLTEKGPLGKATPLAGSFMSYHLGMFEKIFHEAGKAFDSALPAEERKYARRYLAGHATTMALLTGTMGLPFYNLVSGLATKALNLVTDRDDYDVSSAYRSFLSDIFSPTVSDVIARGVPRALGIDLSNLGEADMMPLTQLMVDRRKLEDRLGDLSTGVLGAPGSMLAGVVEGLGEMANGRFLEGAIKGAPVALRNPLKAYKLADQGYVTSGGVGEPLDVGPGDVIAQLLGIKLGDPANYAEATHSMMQLNAARQIHSSSLTKNLLAAYERGDSAAQREALSAAREFDAQHPNHSIIRNLSGNLVQRRKAEETAAALGTPIGLPALDIGMRKQLRYLNQ